MPKVEYKCLYCGKTFYAYESEKRKYCSFKCAMQSPSRSWNKGKSIKVVKTCLTCGKTFLAYKNRKYCSLVCAYKSPLRVWNKGKKGVQITWSKGKTANPNSPNFDPRLLSIAKFARERNRDFIKGDKNPAKRLEVRQKIGEALKGDKNPSKRPEVRRKISLAKIGKKLSEEHRKKLKAKWTPERKAEFLKALKKKPNKLELKFEKMLNDILPNEYKYVGNGEFFLAGKCPDFLNVNGKKKLIEIWGDYWHKNQNPEDVINHYKKYGFDCLVVWEHELKNLADVKEKVVQFTFARENLYEKS